MAIALCLLLPLAMLGAGCAKKGGAGGATSGGPQGQEFKSKVTPAAGSSKAGVGGAAATGGQAPFTGKGKTQ
jgi:hypothetical protein